MSVERSKYVNLQKCKCVDQCSYDGIVYQINSNGLVNNCLISNRSMAIKVMYNSIVTSSNNNGDNNTYGIGAYFTSTIGKNDTQPNGTTAEFIMAGGEIR